MENPTRRRVLAAGFAGTAFGLLGGRAVSAGSTPPTSPPLRPTTDDVVLLTNAHGFELAARDLYDAALAAGAEDPFVGLMRDQHQSFADILLGVLGTRAMNARDEGVFEEFSAAFGETDAVRLAADAYELESALVATHSETLGELQAIDGGRLIAAIAVAEARACTILADIAGKGDDDTALFENSASPLTADSSSGG